MLFMYEYTRTYLEETGVDPRVADSVARGLAGMVFGRTDWAASLFDLEALKAIREDPRISEIYNQVHKDIRRFSDYYISMTPEELSTVADILAYGRPMGCHLRRWPIKSLRPCRGFPLGPSISTYTTSQG